MNYIMALSLLAGLVLVSGLSAESAMSATMDIQAVFRPDPSKPMQNKFINETPVSGHCELQPAFCERRGLFSLVIPIGFQSVAAIEAGHADQRKGAMFRVPGDWQRLSVRNIETQEDAEVEVRIVSIGGQYILPDTAQNLVGEGAPTTVQGWHTRLWGDWTWYPPAPCEATGGMYTQPSRRTFFWMTSNASVCAARANYRIANLAYQKIQIGYELRTPNPLQMSSGRYTGSWTYTVGPGMDFDMGDIMQPNDSTLTLNFNLDVHHTLKVEIPPGGEKVQLVPAGGWQSWLQAGRKPVRLSRDQTFNISASSRFKMSLECEHFQLFNCMIRDPVSQRTAVVQVSVSLPNGLTDLAGQPVSRRPLRIDYGEERQVFQPGFYVDRAPGILHFEMSPFYVNQIVQTGVAANYRGDITVIWDSEV